jgi:uncharacterized protein
MLRRLFFSLALTLGAPPAIAQDFDAGMGAYQAGDYATALREWRPLAEQGNAMAQFNLGVMYDDGEGVAEDDVTALMWVNLAAAQGDTFAVDASAVIAAGLTPDEIATAQSRAGVCLASGYQDCD